MPSSPLTYKQKLWLGGGSLLLLVAALWLWWGSGNEVTIGVEGKYEATLPSEQLTAVPYTHGDALAVRIASATPVENGIRYDIRYMAYGPGEHDLRQFLLTSAGQPALDLPEMTVTVDPLLADDYSGELFATPETPINLHSYYRLAMGLLWALWGLLLLPLAMYGRKRRERVVKLPPPPSIPERLRHLLELAEHEALTAEQQADLEKLLMTFWAERLGVSADRLEDTLEQLRQHPSAGPQVQSVERWLHGRETPANGTVARELLRELGWQADNGRGPHKRGPVA